MFCILHISRSYPLDCYDSWSTSGANKQPRYISDKKNKTTTEEKKREKEGRNPAMLLRCYSKEYLPDRAILIMKLGFDLLLLSFVPIFGEQKGFCRLSLFICGVSIFIGKSSQHCTYLENVFLT